MLGPSTSLVFRLLPQHSHQDLQHLPNLLREPLAKWLTQPQTHVMSPRPQLHGSGGHADQYPRQPPQFPVLR